MNGTQKALDGLNEHVGIAGLNGVAVSELGVDDSLGTRPFGISLYDRIGSLTPHQKKDSSIQVSAQWYSPGPLQGDGITFEIDHSQASTYSRQNAKRRFEGQML
ncbi:hypothetical protein IAQ61_010713 [Plenodomus lingam]|uniref:uncharacterized protein n=1 Tax=Leptosphaeria maculans TaxID=5022 RepID=UPI003323CFC8|nr:hypothetical protein IAQ61_010713 [Plenodomus lingam]